MNEYNHNNCNNFMSLPELEPGHDFLREARPEPVPKILTRPDIFEHFKYPTNLRENEFDTRK